jgi:septal ring factor EnvC (AmiA/AmiB activator)
MEGYHDDFPKPSSSSYSSYKSQITPRSTNVQRRSGGPPGIMTRMYQSYSTTGGSGGFSAGGLGGGISSLASIAGLGNFAGIPLRPNRGTSALVAVNETREREKRELCQLNDKFAQYVEKVRFLEAQNRKLQLELEALQNKAGQGSSKIKEMYEVEMNEAKKLIDDTTRDRAAAEVKARDAEKEANRYRKRYEEILNSRETDRSAIDRLQQQIAENEAQINLFRRRLADLEDEARRYKAETQRLASEIARLQNEIQNETFVKSSLDTEKMALEDELAMLKQMHEADLNELRSKTVVDVNLDPSHFFRNELAQAIRDIRNEFEALNDQQRADLHNRYMMSYNELILRHQKPDLDPIQSEQQRIQEEKLRTTLLTTRNEVAHMKARNEELNNRIRELQLHIDQERDDGKKNKSPSYINNKN